MSRTSKPKEPILGFFPAKPRKEVQQNVEPPEYTSVKTRWKHESLFDVGFVAVPSHFLELYASLKPPLTSGEALFVIQLMNFKWSANDPFPSYGLIAKRMGVTDKAVRRYAKSLQDKKYLHRNERIGKTNTFDLNRLFDALLEAQQIYGRKLNKKRGGDDNE